MFKLIATAALVSLLAACSGMPTGSVAGAGRSTMGASGSMNGGTDTYGTAAGGQSGGTGGPN
jgi:hypothetical protein